MPISKIKAGGINDDAVTTAKIVDGTVAAVDIADGAVTTAKIANGDVTSAKLDTNIDIAGTLDVTGTTTLDGIVNIGTNTNTVYYNNTSTYNASLSLKTNTSNEVAEIAIINGNNNFGSTIDFARTNSAGNDVRYALFGGVADNNTAGSESGHLTFKTKGSSDNNIVERVRVDADGLKFNGDTAAANALNDYEEGTWAPVDNNGNAYNNGVNATYTKIGRIVYVNFDVSSTGSTGGGGIYGLPFTASPSSVTGNWSVYGGYSSSNSDLWGHINQGSNHITMYVGSSSHVLDGRWIGAGFYYTEV